MQVFARPKKMHKPRTGCNFSFCSAPLVFRNDEGLGRVHSASATVSDAFELEYFEPSKQYILKISKL